MLTVAFLVFAGASAATAGSLAEEPLISAPTWLPIIVVLLLAALERLPADLKIRSSTVSVVATEIVTITGLFVLDGKALVIASAVGSVLARAENLRSDATKAAFNVACTSADAALLALVFHALNPAHQLTGPRVWVAVLAAAVASSLWGTLAVTFVIWVHERAVDRARLVKRLAILLTCTLILAMTGLAGVALYLAGPPNVLLLGGGVFAVVVALRTYTRTDARLTRVQGLYRFSSFLATARNTPGGANEALEELRDLLGAASTELLVDDGEADSLRVVRLATGGGPIPERRLVIDFPRSLRRVLRGEPLLAVSAASADEAEAAELVLRDVRSLVAVPLRAEGRVLGALVVTWQSVERATVDDSDRELLESLANHVAIWLEHGRVLEQLRQSVAERERQAVSDSLTGLPNRRGFAEIADRTIAASPECTGAVVLMDLDRFKEVNDTLGHGAGDQLIQLVARRVGKSLPPDWTLARLGGDEFAVLIPDAEGRDTQGLVAGIRSALSKSFEVEGIPLTVEASIGVSVFPEDGADVSTVLRRADMAMYAAKTDGTEVERYSSRIDNSSRSQLALLSDLRTAIDQHSLAVHYQPKVDLLTGEVAGVEALVRWPRAGGMLAPGQFIPQAEQSALMGPLTAWVVQTSVGDYQRWSAQGMWMGVAVNLSARNLADANLPTALDELIAAGQVDAGDVTLEITESAVITNTKRAIDTLEALRSRGFKVSLDDFGTGQASLQLLRQLPVTEVKIDRQFVQGMLLDEDDMSIVRAVIDLARRLGLDVVAEGVQDAETYETLFQLGCNLVQGYYVSRPKPADDLLPQLANPRERWPARRRPATSGIVLAS